MSHLKKEEVIEKNSNRPTSAESVASLSTPAECFFMATGKRKSAVAQVKLYPQGDNQILINNKPLEKYFPYFTWQEIVKSPLTLLNFKDYKIVIKVNGGGVNAQAEAIRLGISRALVKMNHDFRPILKKVKFLTRIAKVKERKKPGLKRARRAPQWQKR
jgi:small subunit ribosomal protein S9